MLLGGIDALLIALVGLIVLAFYHPALLAFDIVLLIGAVIVLIPLGKGGTTTSVAESKAKYAVAGWLQEMARHPLSFKMPGGEEFAKARAENLAGVYLDKRDRHFRIFFRQLIGAMTFEVVASVALLAVGGILVIERQLSIGQLVAAELIVTAVVTSIAKLGGKVEIFYDLVAAVDKLGEIFDLPLERSGGESPPRQDRDRGHLSMQDVELDLQGGESFGPLSLDLNPGDWTAITGAPERVTSSLVDAIFGLNPLRAGTIEVDGHDYRDLALQDIRSRISVVRGTEILPGCIADNLRAANPELSADQAWDVLERVGLNRWVKDSPRGLETDLLAEGEPLTRTQALELTIARALAGKPCVLVLDRTLDQIAPTERLRLFDSLSATRDTSVVLISDEPDLLERADRLIDLSSPSSAQGEAA